MGDKPCDDSDETPPSLIAAEDAHGHDDEDHDHDHDHERQGEGRCKDGEAEAMSKCAATEGTSDSNTSRDFGDQLVASSSAGTTYSCCSSPASGGGGRVDAFLRKFVTFSSSTANADRGIKLVQYLCWLGSRLTACPGDPSKSGGPKTSPLLLLLLLGNRERLTSLGPDVSPGLRKIYFDLSMARYVLRLYGLPQSLEAARNDTWCGGSGWIQRLLGRIMAWSMVAYYPLEHVAYGAWVAPKLIRADAEKYTAWSCRFWTAYIGADLASTVLRLRDLERRRRELLVVMGSDDGGKDDGAGERVGGEELRLRHRQQSEEIRQKIRHDALHAARCVLFALPAIHWSRRDWERRPWLRENVLNGLMLAESVTCLIQSICALS